MPTREKHQPYGTVLLAMFMKVDISKKKKRKYYIVYVCM
jgi:hypothetical protein